jgi:hypothetical protein
VALEATSPSVGETKLEISRKHGTAVEQQELYKIAVRADGGVVREDDAEPEMLEDTSMVLADGDLVAMAVKERLAWQPTFRREDYRGDVHVVLSEEGALATDTMENDDEGNYSMVVASLEVSERGPALLGSGNSRKT